VGRETRGRGDAVDSLTTSTILASSALVPECLQSVREITSAGSRTAGTAS
jgi:hypothetical protein